MNTPDITHFKQICEKVRDAIPSSYTPSWDEDFQVIRIVFDKTEKKSLLKTLTHEFDHQWDFTSIDTASIFIENFISSIFGIIPGQILFTSGNTDAPILFAVWWPWGNEDYISLRVGIFPNDHPISSQNGARDLLLEWFVL